MSERWTQTPVIIETSRHRISGNVAVPEGARLSDYANETDRSFFALTDARLAPIAEPDRERPVGFMLVNRNEVGIVMDGVADERPPMNAVEDGFADFFVTGEDPEVTPVAGPPLASSGQFTRFS